ncbi:hypothetical protein [Streptomyces lancefieldiae]|uniref:Secreted protein n=1 Tax=Streptomyces lancefieldiae TaxID=3075520 RepID=A0ABU3B045_9ACTN|nr:hypothetical protein [Streptomyces sp. DSM 40712]MDT0615821.1 hypothetical protein [Streptomyces sp. DSM 40712]
MGRNPMRAAVTLCAAAALAVPLSTASAAPPAEHTARQTQDPVLVDCSSQPDVRPEAFVLACGDGNSRLSALRWVRWDANSAVGRGTNAINDCVPYCAAGAFHSYPVTVRLDQPRAWEKDPGEQHFTRITLTFTDGRPDGFPRVVTYPLGD